VYTGKAHCSRKDPGTRRELSSIKGSLRRGWVVELGDKRNYVWFARLAFKVEVMALLNIVVLPHAVTKEQNLGVF
jgi:hypothetical protein